MVSSFPLLGGLMAIALICVTEYNAIACECCGTSVIQYYGYMSLHSVANFDRALYIARDGQAVDRAV